MRKPKLPIPAELLDADPLKDVVAPRHNKVPHCMRIDERLKAFIAHASLSWGVTQSDLVNRALIKQYGLEGLIRD